MSTNTLQSYWVVIFFAANLLSPVALADTVTPAPISESTVPDTPPDPEEIFDRAEKAIDTEDMGEGLKLWRQAAELNHIRAQVRLGQFADVAQEYEEAAGWFLTAAMQGDAEGQYELARLYELGNGLEKDNAKASYWYRRAAAKNDIKSAKVLALAYRVGRLGIDINLDQAKAWDAKAKRMEAVKAKEVAEKYAAAIEAKKKEAARQAEIQREVNARIIAEKKAKENK